VLKLLFRGSEHGWSQNDFHIRCDDIGSTICLFKIKNGDCIGGYTNAKWTIDNKGAQDNDAMLFNLSQCRHYSSKQSGLDIFCSSQLGPCFTGIGDSELCAEFEPFNGEEKCCSWGNSSGYGIPIYNGINMLTN
jgi:hypothetical protein